ncbi:MAG TPA: glycosyltransferase family A protein [Bacteroidia bacterium]|nr:glycosyltransferase family A protein [Bacteroidia bacterium]
MNKLTIIFTFRDRDAERVKHSLDSLSAQTVRDFDVVFVDYGSSLIISQQIEKLVKSYSFVTYIYNDTRYRPWNRSHALNTGIRLATTEFVFTADVDMIFKSDFVELCYGMLDPGKAYFFSVYYLPKGYDLSRLNFGPEVEKSKAYALGLGLISRDVLAKMNGYDEFYCYWGKEDNDIESRLRNVGVETIFYDESVLLFHIYHETVHQKHALIPDNWLNFQDSYYKYSKDEPIRNLEFDWGVVREIGSRQCVEYIENPMSEFIYVDGRSDFFRYVLENQFINSEPGTVVALYYNETISETFKKSILYNVLERINRLLAVMRLPLLIQSKYHQNYEDIFRARDEVAHFISVFNKQIFDYSYLISGHEIKVVLIKRAN